MVDPAEIDEEAAPGEEPVAYTSRLAREKAAAVAPRHPQAWIVAADTTVVLAGDMLGKPADAADAAAMIARLAGRRHQVVTGYCVRGPGVERAHTTTSEVHFTPLSKEVIEAYVASGEWRGKAAGYAIQGIAAAFISRVEGSVTNVIGLPLAEVLDALVALGGPAPKWEAGAAV